MPEWTGAPDLHPTAARRRLTAFLLFALLAAAAVAELSVPVYLHVDPVMAAVPALAAAVTGLRTTAATGLATLAVAVALDLVQGVWWEAESRVTLVAVVAVALASALGCWLRQARERELRQVRSVAEAAQRALLRPPPARVGAVRLRSIYLAAEAEARIGGDFYEALRTPFGVRVLIGDVRGKGLPAVGASAALLGAFREAAHRERRIADVAERLEEAAQRHVQSARDAEDFTERFATALLVEIPGEPVVRVVHCGHPVPLVVRDGRVAACPLERYGTPVGLGDLVEGGRTAETVPFAPGDRLLLYTDGVIEARDGQGVFFPLAARAQAHATAPLDAMVDALRTDLLRHASGDLDDDVALLAVERVTA
ncbi:PP2C family protein-serine/threonine phosphatase [Streptomyces sp. TRM 70351]|uniref:PP2C family protein-serine/threonine phosphatase n=1 Tax=Streptomyces sp. TRM 70351 TaxID=3116552 RepID=UPI002E7B319E|nr:PP2C family protein-serine/threonine phosphatase [Streptomyces sp. TRM 70351]MEE1930322.1 PP2C family protein-serine/threonine phosphatase [Streptomyces sp. TRM 70351]